MENTSEKKDKNSVKKPLKHICIGLVAHVDAGKTTLSEGMLYLSGQIRNMGRVDHGDTFLDSYETERERGLTIFSKQAEFIWNDTSITILDTPGHVDFSAEMERVLQVLDCAVLVVSAVDGVQAHTVTLWRLLKQYKIRISSILPAPGGGPGGNIASANPEERKWTKQYWKDCMDMGLELDECKTFLCVCGWYIYGTRQRDAWKWAVESLSEVADYAAENGVTLVLEPTATDSNLVESCDDAMNMMEDIGKENVKLMFDTTHALYRNEVPSDYVYQMGSNLKHIHMADYDRKAPGTNGCDFVDIMQALKDIGYEGYITMENGFPTRSCHPDVVARQSLENLKAIEAQLK